MNFFLSMTDAITSHNIYLSSWITLYTHIPSKAITDSEWVLKWIASSFLKVYEYLKDTSYMWWYLKVSYIQYYNSVITLKS